MPVALAIAATERSISAHRITKVRPTAMIAGDRDLGQDVAEVVERGEGRAGHAEEDDQHDQRHEGRDVAQLAAQRSRRRRARRRHRVMPAPQAAASSRSLLTASPANSRTIRALLHHHDAVGERQHRLRLGRDHDDRRCPGRAGRARSSPRRPWRRHPCRASARSAPAPCGGWVSHLASATFCWLPPDRRAEQRRRPSAAGSTAPRHGRAAIARSTAGLQPQPRDAAEHADRHVLVDRLVVEQHRRAGSPARRRCRRARAAAVLREPHRPAVDRQACRARGLQLAEQRARQLDLAAAHEAVDAQHLAGAHVERDVGEGAAGAEPARRQHDRRVRLAVERDARRCSSPPAPRGRGRSCARSPSALSIAGGRLGRRCAGRCGRS